MKKKKWDYEEIFFKEIDLSPLNKGGSARTFTYADEERTKGYVATIYKSKKTNKYYLKVEWAKKLSESPEIQEKEDTTEDVPF